MINNKNINTKPEKVQIKEEFAIILDVVLENKSSFSDNEVAQAIGTSGYTLLELVPKRDIILKTGDKVYLGDGKRDEIQYIKKSLKKSELSNNASLELEYAVADIVKEKESEFVNFFNRAGPISIRKHSLELVGGVGKKHLSDLMWERDKKPFESFEDITARCPFISKPAQAVSKRIMDEIAEKDDFKFFTHNI
jgi:putative nucleotide binding protein